MRLLCTLIPLLGLSAQAQITISNATLSGVTSGSALLSANQTFTGSNQFSGGMMVWGDANKTNGVWIGPSGEVLSNAVGSVTIAGGNVTASGVIKGTNGLAPGILTVATLPTSPVAGQTCWASDVVTTRGVGDLVTWNGSAWLNRENIPATKDLYSWIMYVKSNSVSTFIENRVSLIIQLSDMQATWSPFNSVPSAVAGTSGSSGYSEVPGVGVFMYLSTGVNYDGSERCYTWVRTGTVTAAETNAVGISVYLGNACSGTESYWAFVGMDENGTTNFVGANNGCGFVYDCYQTNITSAISNTYSFSPTWTNNWIAVGAKSGTAAYKDTGLPVSTSSAALNRLLVTFATTEMVYYTNGTPFWTNSTAGNIPAASPPRHFTAKIVKFLGTTSRTMYLRDLMILQRHAERDM